MERKSFKSALKDRFVISCLTLGFQMRCRKCSKPCIKKGFQSNGKQRFYSKPSSLTIDDGVYNTSSTDLDGYDQVTMFFDYDGGIQGRREKAFNGFSRVQTRHQNQLGNETSYPKRYLTEVVEYFAPSKLDFESRNRHEYLKGLVNNNYSLLHEQNTALEKMGFEPTTS